MYAITGCAAESTDPDWRSMDMCALFQPADLDQVSDRPVELTAQRIDAAESIGCKYSDADTLRVLSAVLHEGDSKPATEESSTIQRTAKFGGQDASIIFENSGVCVVQIKFDRVILDMTIAPRPAVTTGPVSDSHSCDGHRKIIENVIGRTGLE
ncbi:hypothetical protein ACFXK0_26750 [Nocardia sp. NPDC059177]|uniref:hypothetical protein n=1 Tax=Nocardia sp. NPDC059177 TaxID=3346759 RepID=UPI00367FAEA7